MKNILMLMIILAIAVSCTKDENDLSALNGVTAPSNVTAIFDITQDNTGLVSIIPGADGVTMYKVTFGDVAGEIPTSYKLGEKITHNYGEGVYTVGITAVGLTGLSTTYNQEINVTFKAPENLVVTITNDPTNPRLVTVSATADYATIIDMFFGDVTPEEPVHALPGEAVVHTYPGPGSYPLTVIAKSAATAHTVFQDTIVISAASAPVNLPITFESFTVNYAFSDFGNTTSSVIANPDPTGINTSANVGQSIKAAGAETWAGSFLTLENPIDFSANKLFKVKVWSPKSGSVVKLKVENLTNGDLNHEVDATTTVANQWEELSFDFTAINMANTYQKVVIFFDFGNAGDGSTYYFDDVKLVPASVPATLKIEDFEGVAPTFTSFGNIAAIEIVANPDQTGANTTAMVAKMTKTASSETWAGAFFDPGYVLDLNNFSKINVKTWSPKSGCVVKLKLENQGATTVFEVDVNTTVANSWEQLVFDFSAAPAADYIRIVIFFDFGNPGDGSVYYFDEIELANDGGGINPSFLFQDFEGVAPTITSFGNIAAVEIIANPNPSGANTTATVAKMLKTASSETWAGAFFEVGSPLDLVTYSKIKVKTWSPKSGIVKLKLENLNSSVVFEVDATNSTTNAWEELTYDFSGAPSADYVRVVIFFDFGNPGDDSVYYFDEFALTN